MVPLLAVMDSDALVFGDPLTFSTTVRTGTDRELSEGTAAGSGKSDSSRVAGTRRSMALSVGVPSMTVI